jgi:hypothetical protein
MLVKITIPKRFLTLNVHKGTKLVVEFVGTKQTSQHEHVHARKELQMDDLENENEKKVDASFESSHFNLKLLLYSGPLHMKSKNNMANVFEDANEKNDENVEKPFLKKTNLVHKSGRVSKRNVRE